MKKTVLLLLTVFIFCLQLCSCSEEEKTGYVWYQIGKNDPSLYAEAMERGMDLTLPDDAVISVIHDSVTEDCTGFAVIKAGLSASETNTLDKIANIAEWAKIDLEQKTTEYFKKAYEKLSLSTPEGENIYYYFRNEETGTDSATAAIWNDDTKELHIVFALTFDVEMQ